MHSLCHKVVCYNISRKVFLVNKHMWPITDLCAYDQVFKGEKCHVLVIRPQTRALIPFCQKIREKLVRGLDASFIRCRHHNSKQAN